MDPNHYLEFHAQPNRKPATGRPVFSNYFVDEVFFGLSLGLRFLKVNAGKTLVLEQFQYFVCY